VSRILTSKKRKPILGHEEKERLLRIAKRSRNGPLNRAMDGLSEAVRESGSYDPWAPGPPREILKHGLPYQAPVRANPRDSIKVPAVMEPHQGTSYNPPADAHHELLLKAASVEQKRLTKAEKLAEVKTRMESCRVTDSPNICLPPGMTVQEIGDQDEMEDVPVGFISEIRPPPRRKTKAQRNKEARLLAEASAFALSLYIMSYFITLRKRLSPNEFKTDGLLAL